MPERRAILAGATMLAAGLLVPVIEPHRLLARELPPLRLESDVPREFGNWRVDDSIAPILPSPDVQEQLNQIYSQQLTRTYVNSTGQRIMLVIAYGEDQVDKTTVAHLPEACYPAQGFAISPRPSRPVDLGERALGVTRLVARRSTRVEPITYWTTVGGTAFSSDMDRRLTRLVSSLSGVIPDGMLVRVSSIDRNEARAFSAHDEFIRALFGGLSQRSRPRLFGTVKSGI